MGTPFKMKGSPMQRNFGVGSPVKQEKKQLLTPGEKTTYQEKKQQLTPGKKVTYQGKKRLRKDYKVNQKHEANRIFDNHAREIGMLPTFKNTEEMETWYSNKDNVNMLNNAQRKYEGK